MSIPKDYRHVRSIGEGYFCTVSRYVSKSTKKELALKCLKPEHHYIEDYRRRFLREITLLQDLTGHPHIIEMIDCVQDGDDPQLWYAMPVAKENLYKFVKRQNQTLSQQDRIGIFEHVLSAIAHAHSKEILHRDIGPSNVLIFANEKTFWASISDFGLGKDSDAINYTRTSMSGFGQILYMSPEQRDHLKDADHRSDIYSLGKLLYFVMTGKDPVDMRDGDFFTVIRKASQENPKDRYQTIEDMVKEFDAVKAFILAPGTPLEKMTMKEYLTDQKKINWNEFHEVALRGNSDEHTYSDYVGPITYFLLESGNLEKYYASKKDDFLRFVNKYVEEVSSLNGQTHWPFRALDDFGGLYYSILRISDNSEIKFHCICQIWEIAWDANQFAVQKHFRDVQTNNLIPSEIESRFAEYIITNSKNRTASLAPFLGSNCPPVIRRALNQLRKERESDSG